ncbi:hypothetical protein [Alkalicoccus urumqiensis]|uniref:Uncharacterized protein n=1 Tax=Alkalicoccus urumqiensis TaxID=1548213 RepID=A0A2P6MIP8_ALKUR|nr:hypothetical protein [Alkalicoccus urumqiensis]PRO66159.1 hypothetical protein C6I21_04985 [Alkalicoccus urumqiensis]
MSSWSYLLIIGWMLSCVGIVTVSLMRRLQSVYCCKQGKRRQELEQRLQYYLLEGEALGDKRLTARELDWAADYCMDIINSVYTEAVVERIKRFAHLYLALHVKNRLASAKTPLRLRAVTWAGELRIKQAAPDLEQMLLHPKLSRTEEHPFVKRALHQLKENRCHGLYYHTSPPVDIPFHQSVLPGGA